LRALGLKGDAATANVKIRKWLRDKANTRVHGTILSTAVVLLAGRSGRSGFGAIMEVLPLVLCAYNYLPECQVHSGAPILMKAQALQRHRRLDVFRSRCGLNGEAGQICVWRDNLDEAI